MLSDWCPVVAVVAAAVAVAAAIAVLGTVVLAVEVAGHKLPSNRDNTVHHPGYRTACTAAAAPYFAPLDILGRH